MPLAMPLQVQARSTQPEAAAQQQGLHRYLAASPAIMRQWLGGTSLSQEPVSQRQGIVLYAAAETLYLPYMEQNEGQPFSLDEDSMHPAHWLESREGLE